MDEHADLGGVFYGGYGLFTYNGVPKSGYQAMRFLGRLGNTLAGSGDGWFLTRRGGDFQRLLYNYCHYDKLPFINRLGDGVAGWAIGQPMDSSDFKGLAQEIPSAVAMVKNLYIYGSIAAWGAVVVFMLFYHLDKQYDGIVAELARKETFGN